MENLSEIYDSIVNGNKFFEPAVSKLIRWYKLFNISAAKQTITNSGLALSPKDSTDCLSDIQRTYAFIIGVHSALQDLLNRNGEVINVIYAGTGAYAPLIIPALNHFKSDRIKVTFIDIHQESIENVTKIIESLELNNNVDELLVEDAANYTPNKNFDLIVSEVMFRALTTEPQVAVTLNLLPFLKKEGVLIPQKIDILCSIQSNEDIIFSLSKNKIPKFKINQFFSKSISVDKVKGKHYNILLKTRIQVFGDVYLNENESSITDVIVIANSRQLKKSNFNLTYQLSNNPAWKVNY